MKVKDIIERVLLLYHDESYLRIKQEQYLQILDDAILQLILTRPDAHEKRTVVRLLPGPRQVLPEEAFSLIDVYVNKFQIPDIDDYTDGKPVFQVARKDLDYFSNWYSMSQDPTNQIDEFAFDVRTPKQYWVNPPVAKHIPIFVEIGYSYKHPQFAILEEDYEDILEMDIDISEEFRLAIINYMLYTLYSTDSTSQFDRQIADKYLQTFYQVLGIDSKSNLETYSRLIETKNQGIGIHEATDAPTNVRTQ